jgi:hypothetical protein
MVSNGLFSTHFVSDPDPRIRTTDLRIRILLYQSSKIKVSKKSQNSKNQGFSDCFA